MSNNICEYCMKNFPVEIRAIVNEIYSSYSAYIEQDDFEQEVMLTLCEVPSRIILCDRKTAVSIIRRKLDKRLTLYCDKYVKYYKVDKAPEFELADYIPDCVESRLTLNQVLKNLHLTNTEKNVICMHYVEHKTFEEIGLAYNRSEAWASRIHKKSLFRMYLVARRNVMYWI